ncbi:DUF2523 family protein [Alishewanella jeotgali]|uniref:DUF2523 domain-containing protein n=1 Tax=Alishewanella jeotgali KCTC 22429 TaxID=1129374 RepID=H3Z9Z5_9ALTE|nr:DUF2523 family protein [Alishewanella jeotgali]EHR42669.1 hypothetical protein AJE_00730 [Alishewanella jeotgali KCTC 22429]
MPQWLINFGNWLLDTIKTLAFTLFTMIKDVFFFAFEQGMILVTFILQGMGDLFQGLDVTSYIAALPPETSWVLSQIGLGQALGMIMSAITIRFMLQLVPFTRLGS